MSESESSTSKVEEKKQLMNAQTQHGSEETADEENIVVLAKIFQQSPVRETPDDVWHEEFGEQQDDDAVSSTFHFPPEYRISNYFAR